MRRAAWLLALLLVLPACGEDLPSGVLLERPRVLALRVEVDGDPGRASPMPGEATTLRWLVASRDDTAWTAALVACVAAPSQTGLPGCAEAPFATLVTDAPTVAPALPLAIPDASAFGASTEVLIAGVLCAGGVPSLDSEGFPGCTGEGATTEVVTFNLPVTLGPEPANRHPSLGDESVTIDGNTWDPRDSPAPDEGCAALPVEAAFPHVTRQDEETPSVVAITLSPDDREAYRELVFGETPMLVDAREEVTFSHVATGGLFSRLQSIVFEEAQTDVSVEWRHPLAEAVPASGLTVRFLFIARDGRGGMDWIERALCVEP